MIIKLRLPSSNFTTAGSIVPLSTMKSSDIFQHATIKVYDGDRIVTGDISGCTFINHVRGDADNAGLLTLDAPASNVFAQQQQSFDDAIAKLQSRTRTRV